MPTRPKPSPKPRAHTVADHVYGLDLAHTHDGFADHDHDFPDDGPLEDNPLWIADNVSLMTVGIDIGSSGTQVIFSRINLRRLGEDLTSRYLRRLARDAVPVAGGADALSERRAHRRRRSSAPIIDDAYDAAGLNPDDIDTGAVILTGEALRRENAQGIAGMLAEQGRRFRLRHRRPSHGIDAGRLRLRRGHASRARGQAHPQHRYRRRHHQARRWSRAAR